MATRIETARMTMAQAVVKFLSQQYVARDGVEQPFFAGVWGYALGVARGQDPWFRAAWLVAMLLHGLYDHIIVGRGPGLLVATLPMLLFMAVVSFMALRGESPRLARKAAMRSTTFDSCPASAEGFTGRPFIFCSITPRRASS